jgi:hypothetical protein
MSMRQRFYRYGAIGGGSALFGWAASECLGFRDGLVWGLYGEAITCGLIGGVIGAGVNIAGDGLVANRRTMARLALAGLLTGGLAGAIGASVGHALLGSLYGARALGWTLMGAGIGASEGLYERSPRSLRRGMIAGGLAGLAGGLPFGRVYAALSPFSEIASRATAFVLYGWCVGVSIGLAEPAVAKAWLLVGKGVYRIRRRPPPKELARPPVAPAPALKPRPERTSSAPTPPKVASTAKRQATIMTPCPRCKRPVPGTRPYCVVCKISF